MTWLTDERWQMVQATVPVVVVDIVPLLLGDHLMVGLIHRDTPHQGRRWNLVGGRILYGQTIGDAVRQQLRETLGDSVTINVADDEQPHLVAQYSPMGAPNFMHDPRKHAVGLTFALEIGGDVQPRGEALDFKWFPMESLPSRAEWGFEQDRACESCLSRRGYKPGFGVSVQ